MSARLQVAAVQLCSGADAQRNFSDVSALLSRAARAGARLVLLPENALFMGVKEQDKLTWAETFQDGPWQTRLAELAAAQQIYLVCGSLPLRVPDDAGHVSASTLVYGPDGALLARYDKRHLFDVELADGTTYRESKFFRAGRNPPQSFLCDGVRVGLSICYDLRFPELYRQLSAQGAQLLLVPAAFTRTTGKAHWEVLLRARAIENLAGVIAADQCGEHPSGQVSWGHSMIISPWGEILAQAGEEPELIMAEVDLEAQAQRRREFPVLAHRSL